MGPGVGVWEKEEAPDSKAIPPPGAEKLQRQVADLTFPFSRQAKFREQENVFNCRADGNGTAHFEDSRHWQARFDPIVGIARQG